MSYEFTSEQNTVLESLVAKMNRVGFFLVLVGLLLAVGSAVTFVSTYTDTLTKNADVLLDKAGTLKEAGKAAAELKGHLGEFKAQVASNQRAAFWGSIVAMLQALILMGTGMFTRRSSRSFKAVARTEGNDIEHLMKGLTALRNLFSILSSLLILGLLTGLVAIGAAVWFNYFA